VRTAFLLCAFTAFTCGAADLVFEGGRGPGRGQHIVLVSGDEEYRSEEALPQLAKILSTHHGFKCTVLFAIDPADGTINPNRNDNIPGLETLASADLMILFTRFRDLPDAQMKHIVDYVESGKPIVAMRTATHAFQFKNHKTWQRWSWNNKEKEWEGGFGKQVLGETWVSHHGRHAVESTRAITAHGAERHPILKGIRDGDIWGPTDVYTVRTPLPDGSQVLLSGQVLKGMKPEDPPLEGAKNDPMMPVAWTKYYNSSRGKQSRIFTTTMGSSQDLLSEGFRRLLVNATYWAVGMERNIPGKSKADLVGEYKPTPFKFNGYTPGRKPSDYAH
jgi:type 1 glutamine amidotransferase